MPRGEELGWGGEREGEGGGREGEEGRGEGEDYSPKDNLEPMLTR